MEIKNRDRKIDALRGLAILLVVLGHSIQYSGIDFDHNVLFRLIYSFHMPLFMFISGYVSFYSAKGSFNSLKKKTVLLLVPFFSWALIGFLIKVLFQDKNATDFLPFFTNVILHPDDNGLWFLWVLLVINVFVFFLAKLKLNLEIGLGIIWIFLNLILLKYPNLNYFGLTLVKYHLFYFLLGMFFCRTKEKFDFIYKYFLYISCLTFPILVLFWYRLNPPSFITNAITSVTLIKIFWLLYQYICAILGIGLVMKMIEYAYAKKVLATIYLERLGLITLEIYALHFHIFGIWFYIFAFLNITFKIFMVFVFTLIATILIISCIKHSKVLNFILFGQKRTKRRMS